MQKRRAQRHRPDPGDRDPTIFTTEGTDLAAHGYAIDEYLVSGKANVYDWGTDGDAQIPRSKPRAPIRRA